jgi:hypothetical protein
MSEYQYYEFRAIDRPLTPKMMVELRALSSRAEITPTSFSNEYNYGNFRGDPRELTEKYFDAFVYVANWGTRRLILRLPRTAFDAEAAGAYDAGEALSVWTHGEHVLVEIAANEEGGGGWEEGEGWLDALVPLRDDLLAGDRRALYLGWLRSLQEWDEDEDEESPEPAVPPGLGELSPALKSLAEFLWLEPDLVGAAAEASPPLPSGPPPEDLAAWVRALPAGEKDAALLRVLAGEGAALRWELLQRFREEKAQAGPPAAPRRTVAQLREAQEAYAQERRRRKEKKEAAEQARRARAEAGALARRLDELAPRTAEAWREVGALVASKLPKEYDRAVELLRDLQALGERDGRQAETAARIRQLRAEHARKHTFIERLDRAGLPG